MNELTCVRCDALFYVHPQEKEATCPNCGQKYIARKTWYTDDILQTLVLAEEENEQRN